MFCPQCKAERNSDATACPVCAYEWEVNDKQDGWIMLGTVEDKVSADFAREILKSYDIPAVIISRSGFFGDVGLNLTTFHKPGIGLYEVSVPLELTEEAAGILQMALGNTFAQKKEE